LYKYFEVNGKGDDLVKWAVEREINAASNNIICVMINSNMLQASAADLFKPESLVYKLFAVQFYGDLGRKFFSSILAPVVKEVISHNKELEVHN
jgi:hypothetical protein